MLVTRHFAPFAMGLALLTTTGCTLPDVAPFHASTVELEQSFRTVGDSTTAQLQQAGFSEPVGAEDHPATKFQEEWQPRQELMAALTEYSRALNNIAGSANNGQENVRATLDAAEKLAGQFGGSIASTEVSSMIVQIGDGLITVQASRDMAEAVENLDPLLTRIAELLNEDLVALRNYTRDWLRRHGQTLIDLRYDPWVDDYRQLQERRDYLVKLRGRFQAARPHIPERPAVMEEFLKGLQHTDAFDTDSIVTAVLAAHPTPPASASDPEKLTAANEQAAQFNRVVLAELKELEPWLAARAEDFGEYEAAGEAHRVEIARQVLFIETTQAAVTAWAKSHRDLRNALKNKTRYDAEALQQIIGQVRAIADKETP